MAGIISCNNATNPSGTSTTDPAKTKPAVNAQPVQSKLSATGTQMLMGVINQYYTLKNALVATKAASTDSAAMQLTAMTDSLQVFLNKEASTPATIKPYVDTIIMQGKLISGIQDESCEKQRVAFATLSSAMYGLLKNVDLKNTVIYQEHCPMALDEKGANWLSDDSDIRNPYFGKKMIECGEVTDVIK